MKPYGYWTFDRCYEAALKCKTKQQFREQYESAYNIVCKRGWLNDVCNHLIQALKSPNYWTKARCHEAALKCKTKNEFRGRFEGAYSAAFRKGWLKSICSHMQLFRKPNGFWTFERCHKAAMKCKTRAEFDKKFRGAYNVSSKNGWLDIICSHIKATSKPEGFWTRKNLKLEALKYKSKGDFRKYSSGAYTIAYRNGLLDEICSHIQSHGNRYKRMVYVYEFPDNHAYVGLTYNPTKRASDHHVSGTVFDHSQTSGHKIPEQKLISKFIHAKEAAKLEEETKLHYLLNGWMILNKAKTGSLGGNIYKWPKEKCLHVALTCKTRNEFLKKSASAYGSAWKNGWLSEICSHMNETTNPPNYWTKKRCHEIALQFKTKREFRAKFQTTYSTAWRNGWLVRISNHMEEIRKPSNYWTLELCRKEAKKYETRKEFRKKSSRAYDAALRRKWLNKICGHMKIEWRIRPVIQLSKAGMEIRRFDSIRQAANEIGVNFTGISSCCSGREKTAYGFKWKYAD